MSSRNVYVCHTFAFHIRSHTGLCAGGLYARIQTPRGIAHGHTYPYNAIIILNHVYLAIHLCSRLLLVRPGRCLYSHIPLCVHWSRPSYHCVPIQYWNYPIRSVYLLWRKILRLVHFNLIVHICLLSRHTFLDLSTFLCSFWI